LENENIMKTKETASTPAFEKTPAPPAEAKTAPLTVGDYFVMLIVFALPLVNLILALVWGFGSNANINRKNFARAWLIMLLVCIILGILSGIIIGLAAAAFMPAIQEFLDSLQIIGA
jgi:hypothetical protein